jgi:transposase
VTGRDSGDAEVLPEVLEQVAVPIKQVSVDGAYDTERSYRTIEAHGAVAVIPPRENAVVNEGPQWAARNVTMERVVEIGRAAWKEESGYHRRSLAETAVFRLKTLFGERLSSRREERQRTEGAIRCAALNRMTHLGMPDSFKIAAA